MGAAPISGAMLDGNGNASCDGCGRSKKPDEIGWLDYYGDDYCQQCRIGGPEGDIYNDFTRR